MLTFYTLFLRDEDLFVVLTISRSLFLDLSFVWHQRPIWNRSNSSASAGSSTRSRDHHHSSANKAAQVGAKACRRLIRCEYFRDIGYILKLCWTSCEFILASVSSSSVGSWWHLRTLKCSRTLDRFRWVRWPQRRSSSSAPLSYRPLCSPDPSPTTATVRSWAPPLTRSRTYGGSWW